MKPWMALVGIWLLVPYPALAQQPSEDPLTLPVAVEIALKTHPTVRMAEAGVAAAAARAGEARAGRWPTVRLSESLVRSNNPVFVFGSLLEQSRFGPGNFALPSLNNPDGLTNFRTAATVRMPIFDQFGTSTRIAKGEIGERQAAANRDFAEQQVRFEVIRSFVGVLIAQANKKVADDAVATAEADQKRVADLVETGIVVIADRLSLDVQVAEFRQRQIQAENDVAVAGAVLNAALGLPIESPRRIDGELLERAFTVPSQSELLRIALERRPDYHLDKLGMDRSEQEVKAARGQYLPRIEGFASVGASSGWNALGSTDYTVGLTATFDVFDKGRGDRLGIARAERGIASAEADRKANEITLDVFRAYRNFITARERLAVAAAAVTQATEALRIIRERHAAGLATVTDVLRAQTALVRARTDQLETRYDHYVGYAQILLATGQLTDIAAFTK